MLFKFICYTIFCTLCIFFKTMYIYLFIYNIPIVIYATKDPTSFPLFSLCFQCSSTFFSLETQVAEKRALLNFNVADTEECQKALFETLHAWWIIPLSKYLGTTIWKWLHNLILRGRKRSPWLLTTYPSSGGPSSKYLVA